MLLRTVGIAIGDSYTLNAWMFFEAAPKPICSTTGGMGNYVCHSSASSESQQCLFLPHAGRGPEPHLACAIFPDGIQLDEAKAYSLQLLGSMDGLNFAVATFSRVHDVPRAAVVVSAEADAIQRVRQISKTSSGVEIAFNQVLPAQMR